MANETTKVYNCRIRDLPGFSVFDDTRCGLITHTLRVHKTPEYHKEKFQPNLLEKKFTWKKIKLKERFRSNTKDRWNLLKTKKGEKGNKKTKCQIRKSYYTAIEFSTQSNLDADSISEPIY